METYQSSKVEGKVPIRAYTNKANEASNSGSEDRQRTYLSHFLLKVENVIDLTIALKETTIMKELWGLVKSNLLIE